MQAHEGLGVGVKVDDGVDCPLVLGELPSVLDIVGCAGLTGC
jgi:hypothetical protein